MTSPVSIKRASRVTLQFKCPMEVSEIRRLATLIVDTCDALNCDPQQKLAVSLEAAKSIIFLCSNVHVAEAVLVKSSVKTDEVLGDTGRDKQNRHGECGPVEPPNGMRVCDIIDRVNCRKRAASSSENGDNALDESVRERLQKQNECDLDAKPNDLKVRAVAGSYVLSFGKHKGQAIKDLPIGYIRWILGGKQNGRKIEALPADRPKWIWDTQMETVVNVQKYMLWRCWVCGAADTRYKTAKLCSGCWFESA